MSNRGHVQEVVATDFYLQQSHILHASRWQDHIQQNEKYQDKKLSLIRAQIFELMLRF